MGRLRRRGVGGTTMITDKQKKFILRLYEEIGQEPETDIDNITKQEASKTIKELLEIKKELK